MQGLLAQYQVDERQKSLGQHKEQKQWPQEKNDEIL